MRLCDSCELVLQLDTFFSPHAQDGEPWGVALVLLLLLLVVVGLVEGGIHGAVPDREFSPVIGPK